MEAQRLEVLFRQMGWVSVSISLVFMYGFRTIVAELEQIRKIGEWLVPSDWAICGSRGRGIPARQILVPSHVWIVVGVLITAIAAPLGGSLMGQEAPGQWHLGAGRASMHRSDRTGFVVSAGHTRAVDDRQLLRLGAGIATGSADEGFAVASGRAVMVPLPGDEFGSPYLAVEAGALWEPEFTGAVLSIEVGLLIRATDRLGLRGFAGWGSHDGRMGPRYIGLGIDVGG